MLAVVVRGLVVVVIVVCVYVCVYGVCVCVCSAMCWWGDTVASVYDIFEHALERKVFFVQA